MSLNTPSFNGTVPKNIWSDVSIDVVKVIINGVGAKQLPNEVLQKKLKDESIIIDENDQHVNISIIDSKRRRYVYANKLKYEHRQTLNIIYDGQLLTLLLIDPKDARAEITLLHMPIQTNTAVIEYIFKSMNPNWKTSGIRHAPGKQKRGDRWQLYLECDDKKSIPDAFLLREMGPESQDINVKLFVSGRSDSQMSINEQTEEKILTTPPPPSQPHPSPKSSAPPPPPKLFSRRPVCSDAADNNSTNDNINGEASAHDNTSFGEANTDTRKTRPTPSPEPDPKRAKPNLLMNNGLSVTEEADQWKLVGKKFVRMG